MENFDFFIDAGIENGRILQAVAKRFIVQQDFRARRNQRRRGSVPIVNPFIERHSESAVYLLRLWFLKTMIAEECFEGSASVFHFVTKTAEFVPQKIVGCTLQGFIVVVPPRLFARG